MSVCFKCGDRIRDYYGYCYECGNEIQQENAALRQQIESMKCCINCQWELDCNKNKYPDCYEGEYKNWEMKTE